MEKLVSKNSELATSKSALRLELTAAQEVQELMAKRSHAAQKAIQDLVRLLS